MNDRSRFLVLHNYGMGGVWWWIRAASAEEIVETVAEVEVVTDQSSIDMVSAWDHVDEVDLGAGTNEHLNEMVQQRALERQDPDYGKLIGRGTVYVREDADDMIDLMEIDPSGYRTRQILVTEDDGAIRYDDFPINPFFDLRSPELTRMEIPAAVFEEQWARARPEPLQDEV